MEKRAKLEAIDKMLRELDDIKNSQTSLLKKIAQLEAENINAGVTCLIKVCLIYIARQMTALELLQIDRRSAGLS
jgi:hypothetical protein